MYVQRVEITVADGKFANIQPWIDRRVEHLMAQKGFKEYLVLRSMGSPEKGVNLVTWESREAYLAWLEGPESEAFGKANPAQGLFTANRLHESYEDVFDISREGRTGFANLVDWNIKPGIANTIAFENSRKELFEIRQAQAGGHLGSRLLRFLGAPNRYLVVNLSASQEDSMALGINPQILDFLRSHPSDNYVTVPIVQENFEVVLRV